MRILYIITNTELGGVQQVCIDLCNCASTEGHAVVVASMACGLPVISTDCGGTAEVVQDSRYLVPPGNPQVLAEKMREIANLSQDQRLLIGGQNRNKVQKFDLGHSAANWIQIYRELIGARP